MMRAATKCFLSMTLLTAPACTTYRTLTPPPPSRVANLNTEDNELRVSPGIALGFECITAGGNPCGDGQATIDDPKVAKVYPAHVNRLERYLDGSFAPTSYVVVGVTPGETVLRIADEDPLRVIVVPDPKP
jgi:hypothetical protein